MKTTNEIKQEALKNKVPIIFDDTASFLCDFIFKNKPLKVLEIGTAVGYSARIMLESFNSLKLITIENDKTRFNIAKDNLKPFKKRIKQILGDAGKVIKKLKRKFDLIFLDGPKGQYGNYFNDLVRILNVGGTIIADNIYFHGVAIGKKPCTRGMRAMIKGLHDFIISAKMSCLKVVEFEIGDGILQITKESE